MTKTCQQSSQTMTQIHDHRHAHRQRHDSDPCQHMPQTCQHSFHRRVIDGASIHVGSCHQSMSTVHVTDVSWTGLRSMSPPCPCTVHVNIPCHRRVMDEASSMSAPMPHSPRQHYMSQTCHRRGYTPRHSLNNTPQGAAGSAKQINTPQGTAVAWHLNKKCHAFTPPTCERRNFRTHVKGV